MLYAPAWFPHLQEDEERRVAAALERRRIILERAEPDRGPLRERLSRALAAARPAPEPATGCCCPA